MSERRGQGIDAAEADADGSVGERLSDGAVDEGALAVHHGDAGRRVGHQLELGVPAVPQERRDDLVGDGG